MVVDTNYIGCRYVNECSRTIIEVESEKNKLYIIPVYIDCNKWMDDFVELYNFLLESGKENIMPIGDFNGRIRNLQVLEFDLGLMTSSIKEVRCAKDNKIDGNGRKLVEM